MLPKDLLAKWGAAHDFRSAVVSFIDRDREWHDVEPNNKRHFVFDLLDGVEKLYGEALYLETVYEEPEKAETISSPEEILNATVYQERAKIREVFVDDGNFSKQCVVLDPEAEVQICSLNGGWHFSKRIARQEFKELHEQARPDHVFFAPPCRAWSAMLCRNTRRPEVSERIMKERDAQEKTFLRIINRNFAVQDRDGKGITMEHPADAESWNAEALQFPGTVDAVLHRCRTGLAILDELGSPHGLARKPTRFRSTSRHVREQLDSKCVCNSPHANLHGGPLLKAQSYEKPLAQLWAKVTLKDFYDAKELTSPKMSSPTRPTRKARSFMPSFAATSTRM